MNEAIRLIRELLNRLSEESPDTFKKIQWISGILIIFIPAFLTIDNYLEIGIAEKVIFLTLTWGKMLTTIETLLIGAFAVAKATVKNIDKLTEKLHKKNLLPKK